MMKRMMVVLALALLWAPALLAQMTGDQKPAMMPECAAMMQQHEAMQKHMAEMEAKLQALVDEMNKAKGSARVDKMEAVINELVAQRATMMKQMMDMQPKMIEHMMAHLRAGMMSSMSACPMMKGSESVPAPPAAEHQH
jgi:hypothetical protein